MEDLRVSTRLEPIIQKINQQNMPEAQKLRAIGVAVAGVLSSIEAVVRPKLLVQPSILPARDSTISDWLIGEYEKMRQSGIPKTEILLALEKMEHGALVKKREEG